MKRQILSLLSFSALALFSFNGISVNDTLVKKQKERGPVFSNVIYQGDDSIYKNNPLKADEFYSPVLQGCYPDPAITRKEDDYYMVCSSFAMFPGVPIFHSKDLVNWTDLGGVLNNVNEFNPHDTGISQGVYAPGITYNPHNDTFYMIVTAFTGNMGNIIVKTKDPKKGWGSPIKLDFNGIDPCIFFDNGKGYIVHNDAPDKGKELYEGHRVIKVWEYDVINDKVIPGTDKIIVDGGVDLSKKPIWIEAPHLYKKDGHYYLMCAEGGTGDDHSEVVFISDNPKGPFKPASNNPILTQRYFPKERKDKVDWAGHADLVLGPDNKYYGVFLGIRPNDKDRVNTGRETFMLPVDWSGLFPVFENGLVPMEPKIKMPKGVTENKAGKDGFFPNGNFTFTENFTSEKLDYRWIGLRGPRENFAVVNKKGLLINPFAVSIKELKPTSTLFYRQQHNTFSFAATIDYKPASEKDLAGIVCLQNERYNYVFGVTKNGKDTYIVLERTEKGVSKIMASAKIEIRKNIRLQVKAAGDRYEFSYALNGTDFENLGGSVSGDILSTNLAGGFTGALVGLYATTSNDTQVK